MNIVWKGYANPPGLAIEPYANRGEAARDAPGERNLWRLLLLGFFIATAIIQRAAYYIYAHAIPELSTAGLDTRARKENIKRT